MKAAAIFYSLIETCLLLGVNPKAYLSTMAWTPSGEIQGMIRASCSRKKASIFSSPAFKASIHFETITSTALTPVNSLAWMPASSQIAGLSSRAGFPSTLYAFPRVTNNKGRP